MDSLQGFFVPNLLTSSWSSQNEISPWWCRLSLGKFITTIRVRSRSTRLFP